MVAGSLAHDRSSLAHDRKPRASARGWASAQQASKVRGVFLLGMQKVRRPASYPERGSLLGEQANIEEIAQKNNRWRECWLTVSFL